MAAPVSTQQWVMSRSAGLLRLLGRLRAPLFTWGTAYFLLWCYRSTFSVLAEVVIMRLTNIADTRNYQSRQLLQTIEALESIATPGGTFFLQGVATALTDLVGGVLGTLTFGNPIAINIGFQTIGFNGLVAFLRAVDPAQRKVLFFLMLLPSITVWSSLASKEALLTCFVGVVCAHVVRIYKNTDRLSVAALFCFALMAIYKPHFVPAMLLLLAVPYVARYSPQKATLALLAVVASLVALYLFRDRIDSFALWVDAALNAMGGKSGRELFLVEQYDVFLKAPLGMYLSFTGPTFDEANKGFLQLVTFGESILIMAILLYQLLRRLPQIPVYNLVLSLGALFWILFPTYPPAVSNPGTAIRYRTGYILIVFLCFVVMLSRPLYTDWVRGWRVRHARGRRSADAGGMPQV